MTNHSGSVCTLYLFDHRNLQSVPFTVDFEKSNRLMANGTKSTKQIRCPVPDAQSRFALANSSDPRPDVNFIFHPSTIVVLSSSALTQPTGLDSGVHSREARKMRRQTKNILTTVTALFVMSVFLKMADLQQGPYELEATRRLTLDKSVKELSPMQKLQTLRELAQEERRLVRRSMVSGTTVKMVTDIVCHLIVVDTFLPLGEQSTYNTSVASFEMDSPINADEQGNDEIGCVPMSGEVETQDLLLVNGLNASWVATNQEMLFNSGLYVSFANVVIDRGSVEVTSASTVSLVTMKFSHMKSHIQALQERRTVDIAVVLVSTIDSSPTFSADDVKDILFNENRVNLMTQFDACSFGKLKFQLAPAGVVSVTVNEPASNFDSGLALATAAQAELEKSSPYRMEQLGEKVLVCLPPNVGSRPWVASAGVGHWRAQFNDVWCLSLSATIHEIGHTLGLTHANQNGEKYGDKTGYMAAGYRSQTHPRRCFNGIKSWQLGWYKTRHHWIDPLASGDQLIKLAPIVDFDKTTADEAVIISIRDEFYVTFNRAKGINLGTGGKRNQVILTTTGDGGSESLAGLDVGDTYEVKDYMNSGHSLVVAVCEFQRGRRGAPDIVFVSIGIGSASLCRISTIFDRFNGFLPVRS